jgi:hypothetical protein
MGWIGVITNAGAALLAQWAAGSETLTIEGASVGSGSVVEANMRLAVALQSEKATAPIVSTKATAAGTKFKIQVGPAADEVGAYTAHEIGIWAKLGSGPKTLLALHQDIAGGVSVPTVSTSPNFAFALYATHAISNEGTLSVVIDAGAYATMSSLAEEIAPVSAAANAGKAHSLVPHAPAEATKNVVARFTATIGTTWTGSEAPYSQEISVSGMLATDAPMVDIVQTGNEATDSVMRDAWSGVTRIVTKANGITVYADEAIETSIPIQLKVVR